MAIRNLHPQYSNPSIIEAIIEIHFNNLLSNKDMDVIADELGKNYECKKDNIVSYTAAIGERGMSIGHEKTGQFRLQIQKSKHILVQVFSSRFSVHWLGKYQGWQLFESEFLKVWKDLQTSFPKIQSKKIGVRFINKLEEKTLDQPLQTWFKPSPNYPKNLLACKSDFFYRGKWSTTDNEIPGQRHIMITLAESEPINENRRPLLYDIDVIHSCHKTFSNKKQIIHIISSLHEAIWTIFSSSISNHFKQFLKKLSKV